jgi:2'-5' RNA ligase
MEIFSIKKEKQSELDKILKIDEISRLSITIKDGSVFNDESHVYVILEGVEERLSVARNELSKISDPLDEKEKERVKSFIEKERSDVLNGIGSIFG